MSTTRTYPVLSRRQIEGLIADGRSIFILDQYVFKADPWLQYHPGGDKAILHMVGRDATDEVTALVSPFFSSPCFMHHVTSDVYVPPCHTRSVLELKFPNIFVYYLVSTPPKQGSR